MEELAPKQTRRLCAAEEGPMVTPVKTLDGARLVRSSRRQGLKFNMLLCGRVGTQEEIRTLKP